MLMVEIKNEMNVKEDIADFTAQMEEAQAVVDAGNDTAGDKAQLVAELQDRIGSLEGSLLDSGPIIEAMTAEVTKAQAEALTIASVITEVEQNIRLSEA
jgi:hypothetical protein